MTTQKTAEDAATAVQNRAVDLCGQAYRMTPVQLTPGGDKVSASAELTCQTAAAPAAPAPPAPVAPPAASAPPPAASSSTAVPEHL